MHDRHLVSASSSKPSDAGAASDGARRGLSDPAGARLGWRAISSGWGAQVTDDPIHVTRWGDAGPRVLLIHGGAQGSEVGGDKHFSRQAELAGRGLQLLAPDRPGHGRSPDPGRPDDAEADGAWVAEMLGDGGHLVGHSFGGCVALEAASRRPQAVRSLTLIEPALLGLAVNRPEVRSLLFKIIGTNLFTFSDGERIKRFSKLLHIPDEIRGGSDDAMLKRMGQAIKRLKLPPPPRLKQQVEAVRRAGIPLLIVTGGWSPAFDTAAETAARLGGGRHVVIPSPHHFPQLVSDAFNDALLRHVERAEGMRAHAT